MAAIARLKLLDEDGAQFWVNLGLDSHATEHVDDATLSGLLLL